MNHSKGNFMIKTVLFLFGLCLLNAQDKTDDIYIIDYVKILNNNRAETLYYYENNWKYFREIAEEKSYIKSYALIDVSDRDADYDLILMTVFEDQAQYDEIEARFKAVMSKRTGGPKMMNNKGKNEIRKIVSNVTGKKLF